jgi:hypothetical protein
MNDRTTQGSQRVPAAFLGALRAFSWSRSGVVVHQMNVPDEFAQIAAHQPAESCI